MKKHLLCMPLATLLVAACGSDGDGPAAGDGGDNAPNELTPMELSRAQAELVARQNGSALALLDNVCQLNPGDNVVLSPLGLNMALSLLANGAAGATLDEIAAFVGGPEASLDVVNQYCRLMKDQLPSLDETTTLALANSLWLDLTFSVKPAFVAAGEKWYDATTHVVDISTEATRLAFNKWAEESTNGVIKDFYKTTLPAETRLVLANALYFKGEWAHTFCRENTTAGSFANASGATAQVQMMTDEIPCLDYQEADGLKVATMGYGNGAYAMTVAVDPSGDIAQTIAKLAALDRSAARQEVDVYVTMPKFDVECTADLERTLRSMGVARIWDANVADFSPLTDEPVTVSAVKQKSRIIVDEEGTEAAAVTTVEVEAAVAPDFDFIDLDRPFVFLIQERTTGVILFTGAIVEL